MSGEGAGSSGTGGLLCELRNLTTCRNGHIIPLPSSSSSAAGKEENNAAAFHENIDSDGMRRARSILLLAVLVVTSCQAACNVSKYKKEWGQLDYDGALRLDPDFWRYQTQQQFKLSNELALQLAYGLCKAKMEDLILWKAGHHGPVDDITTYDVMCSKFCLENDALHEAAMAYTECSCLQLSSQPGDFSYIVEGDWCSHNTGRMQCDILGFCGFWECRIDDFMCPRYEYNKRYITYAGPGTCSGASALVLQWFSYIACLVFIVSLSSLF